jgi:hypothetical protein
LTNDGIFIFDVFHELTIKPMEGKNWNISGGNDFWNKEPYFLMEETKYFNNIVGRRYLIINQNTVKVKEFIMWDQYYNEKSIKEQLKNNGFNVKEINKELLEGTEGKTIFVIAAKNCT